MSIHAYYKACHVERCKQLDDVGEAGHVEASTKRQALAALLLG